MASVHKRSFGYEIRFFFADKRRSFYLGENSDKKTALSVSRKLEKLAFVATHDETPPLEISQWLLSLNDRQHSKLASWGLVKYRSQVAAEIEAKRLAEEAATQAEADTVLTLGKWATEYRSKKASLKPSTIEQIKIAHDNLIEFFTADKPLDEITPGDAEDYRNWLLSKSDVRGKSGIGLARNTARRRIGRAKELFRSAVRHRKITESPFADEVAAVGANVERQVFVPTDWIEACIKKAPCEDWRIILAFARYAGMRNHETLIQRWEDIDIPNRRMIVRSNKTPPERVCPIFPELLPHLMRAREMAKPGAVYVQNRYQVGSNITTTMAKIVKRAGLVPWDKLMQNLRATRETELMALYPIKDVASWLGNSSPVAMKHYAMTMERSFQQATEKGAIGVVPQQVHHSAAIQANPEQSERLEDAEKTAILLLGELAAFSQSCPTRTRT